MKTRQGRGKSPTSLSSSAKKNLGRPRLQSTARKLTRSFSNASITSSSRFGGSIAGEELFASWNGRTLIITGLQDHHWQQLEDGSLIQHKEETEFVDNKMQPVSLQPSEVASEVDDTAPGHQTQAPRSGDTNGIKTRTGARRGRPRGRGRGRRKSRLKSATMREDMLSEEEAYSPNKSYLKEFQQKAEDEAENLQRIKNSSVSPEKLSEQRSHDQQGTDTPALTPSPIEIDDTLTAEDLPSPYLSRASTPESSTDLDAAALLMKERFLPLPPLSSFSEPLTRYSPSARTTATLYALAENAQRALVSWQTEYLKLDARTAPAAHPPKRPATGGRVPIDPITWDAIKQSELYGYTLDPRREPSAQDPFVQRGWRRGGAFASGVRAGEAGSGRGGGRGRASHRARGNNHSRRISSQDGRELRLRRKRGYADSDEDVEEEVEEGEEEEEEEAEEEERKEREETYDINDEDYRLGPAKRGRRSNPRLGHDTPDSKRGSAAPEHEVRSEPVRKRGRPSTASILARQLEAREEVSPSVTPQVPRRRGRPPGSKNSARRSDAGIKKGPRVKPGVSPATASRTATPVTINERDRSAGGDSSVNTRFDPAKPLPIPNSILTTLPPTRRDLQSPSALGFSSIHADEAISPHNPTPNPYLESMHSAMSRTTTPVGSVNTDKMKLGRASSPAMSDRQIQFATASPSPKRYEQQQQQKQQQQQPKSEKRSASITKWWAQRKAKEAAAAATAAATATGGCRPNASVPSPVPETESGAAPAATAIVSANAEPHHRSLATAHEHGDNNGGSAGIDTLTKSGADNDDHNNDTKHGTEAATAAAAAAPDATSSTDLPIPAKIEGADEVADEEDSMLGADSDTDGMPERNGDRSSDRRLGGNVGGGPTSAATAIYNEDGAGPDFR